MTEADQEDQALNKDALPASLEHFGEDYSKYLYSDTETESELEFSDEQNDEDDEGGAANYKILQSKSALKTILTQINTKDDLEFEELQTKLEDLQEVCQKNKSILSDQTQLLEHKIKSKALKRLICKWEEVEKQIVDKLQYLVDMQNICKNISIVTEDLETVDNIIHEEDEEDKGKDYYVDCQDDCEVVEMRHQLFEVRTVL